MKKFSKIFLTLRFVLFIVFTISITLFFLIYNICQKSFIESAQTIAFDSTKYVQELRNYYATEVVEKIENNNTGNIEISYDHYNHPNVIPLPSTFILDLSDLIVSKNLSLGFKFYSEYPFTNRANRVLDKFQLDAIEALKKNPEKPFSRLEQIEGKPYIRLAVADKMVASNCIQCHNKHPNSTKRDWKIGDFRGVLETQYELERPFLLAKKLSLQAFLFVFISISILALFIFFLIKKVKRDLTKNILVRAEMSASAKIQRSLIPKEQLMTVNGIEISSYFKPAEECAGDWWQYYVLDENRILILIGDVTGHGISSALVTAVVKGYCDNIKNKKEFNLNDILQELSYTVKSISNYEFKLMSLFALLIDSKTKTMKYCNAGHPFPLYKSSKAENKLKSLIVAGRLLGEDVSKFNSNDIYEEKEMIIEKEDVIVLYSDGLIERQKKVQQNYKTKQLYKILEQTHSNSAEIIQQKIVEDIDLFYKKVSQSDDITLVVVKIKW